MARLPNIVRHLNVFLAAVEEGQFKHAAARLGTVGSAVSYHIASLEAELGVALFERTREGVKLTSEGAVFRADLDCVFAAMRGAIERTRRSRPARGEPLRVGLIEHVIRNPLVVGVLTRFRTACADVDLHLVPMCSEEQDQAMKAGDIDVGFYHRSTPRSSGLNYQTVLVHELLLAMPRAGRSARAPGVRLAELAEERFVFPPYMQAPAIHDRLMSNFRHASVRPRIVMEAGTAETMMAMASAGAAIGFCEKSFRGTELPNVVLQPMLDVPDPLDLEMELVWRRDDSSSAVARFVATALGELVARLPRRSAIHPHRPGRRTGRPSTAG